MGHVPKPYFKKQNKTKNPTHLNRKKGKGRKRLQEEVEEKKTEERRGRSERKSGKEDIPVLKPHNLFYLNCNPTAKAQTVSNS